MQAYKDYCVQILPRDVVYDSVPGFEDDNDNDNDERSLSRLVKGLPQTSRLLYHSALLFLLFLGAILPVTIHFLAFGHVFVFVRLGGMGRSW
ncbi:hypothetical protein BT96DRAFT_272238 [Gymnopus androsaceus JB14]|uniref:Uncharacterized protein n=1 Tax=Gymnopus androsaceus JB14 TaxID=1447944 RepID=A0A6A4H330_9AGAR|nr:hypothetical protein BT96DRAFT_272238 [Gymnopus androsaceus JB14]